MRYPDKGIPCGGVGSSSWKSMVKGPNGMVVPTDRDDNGKKTTMGDVTVANVCGDMALIATHSEKEISTVMAMATDVAETLNREETMALVVAETTVGPHGVAPTTTKPVKNGKIKANATAITTDACGELEENDTESDSVAVAPVVASDPRVPDENGVTEASKIAKEDDDLAGATSVEDALSPEVICVDSDASEAVKSDESVEVTHRRRRKRTRVLGFSHNKTRPKKRQRQADATNDAVAPRVRARRQQSGDSVHDMLTLDGMMPPTAVPWDWDACRVYFDSLTQTAMDDLASTRRECARLVAANSHVWGSIRRLEHDGAYLARMITDVGDEDDVDALCVRPTRRGRFFRDAWEEEDFLASLQRPSRTGKKRPFAGCEGIASYRELVRGYDDDLFTAYVKRLEAQVTQPTAAPNGTTEPQRIKETTTPPRRLKTVKRRPGPVDTETLPPIPVHHLHPAACGTWKLQNQSTRSFEVLHPACIRLKTPERWVEEIEREGVQLEEPPSSTLRRSGRHEIKQDDVVKSEPEEQETKSTADETLRDEVIQLPSFGVTLEEDELSREINNSAMRLVEVSSLNWRRTQTLYERAVSYIEVTPLLQAEEGAKLRVEQFYKTLYPPPPPTTDDGEIEFERELKFRRRPRDLVAFITNNTSTSTPESFAICGSVEFALRVQKGEPIDVLDRNGCWNDGVVIDLYTDDGGDTKSVHVSFALWGGDSTEWVSVTEARILPRGVADGRGSFTLAPVRGRKRFIELNKQVADLLQSTYPMRRNKRFQINLTTASDEPYDEESTKVSGKKNRRR